MLAGLAARRLSTLVLAALATTLLAAVPSRGLAGLRAHGQPGPAAWLSVPSFADRLVFATALRVRPAAARDVAPSIAATSSESNIGHVIENPDGTGVDLIARTGRQTTSTTETTGARRTCGAYETVYAPDVGVPPSMTVGIDATDGPLVKPGSNGESVLMRRTCQQISSNGVVVNVETEFTWRSVATQIRQLVNVAVGSLAFLTPQPRFAPPARSRTLVGVDTWFWVPASSWRPITKVVAAPPVVVTATAVPTGLTFTPGDGSAPVTCPGPGIPWVGVGLPGSLASPCSHTYQRASTGRGNGRYRASMAKLWTVYWYSNTGASGVIGPLPTSTSFNVKVAEAEAVLERPS